LKMKIIIYPLLISNRCRMRSTTDIGNKTANINIKNDSLSTMLGDGPKTTTIIKS